MRSLASFKSFHDGSSSIEMILLLPLAVLLLNLHPVMPQTDFWCWALLLVVSSYAQHELGLRNRLSNATLTLSSPSGGLSHQYRPQITGRPQQLNSTALPGAGMVLYDNTTFATSCAYNDTSCATECSWHYEACSRTWADWSRTGLKRSMNTAVYETETQPWYDGTQSVKTIDGYTYAMGPWTRTKTKTTVLTVYNPQLEIFSTLAPKPSCATPTFECTKQSWCNTNACTVQGGTVELLFWPSTSVVPGLNNSTAGPVTAIYKDTTLTSPSVYLEYKTAYALNGCSQKVGGSYPGAILALDPDDLYSINAKADYFIVTTTINHREHTTSFYEKDKVNYNDLTGLPPGSAYQQMPICIASGCGIITPSLFHPQLVVPTHIREMDPAWSTCDLDWRGSWDPPIALTGAKSMAGPTTPAEPMRTEPASPKSTIDGPARATASPDEAKPLSQAIPLRETGSDPAKATAVPGEGNPLSQAIPSDDPHDDPQDVRTRHPILTYAPLTTSDQPISASTYALSHPDSTHPSVIEATDPPQADSPPKTVSRAPASSISYSYQPAPSNQLSDDRSPLPQASKLHGNTDTNTDPNQNQNPGPALKISYQPIPDPPSNAYEVLSAALETATASAIPTTELPEATSSCTSTPTKPTTIESPDHSSAAESSSSLPQNSESFLPNVTEDNAGDATTRTTTANSTSSPGNSDGGSILPSVTGGDGTISLPLVTKEGTGGVPSSTSRSPAASSSPSSGAGGEDDVGDESSATASEAGRVEREFVGALLWLAIIAGVCIA